MDIRKKFIVDKKFQYNLILQNLFLLLITFALIAVTLLIWERHQLKQGFLIRLPQNSVVLEWAKANNVKPDSAEFMRQFIRMSKVYTFFDLLWKPMAVVLLLNVIMLIIANIYYSNKIAGPISRLKTILSEKINGQEVETVYFRKNDAFHELAELVNKVLQSEESRKTGK